MAVSAEEESPLPEQIETIDDYIAAAPDEVRPILQEMRQSIHAAAPGAAETISYKIPTFKLGGKALVYFAAWKEHVGLYPVPPLDLDLEQEVARFRSGKDTVRFPLGQPIPPGLVERIVAFLVQRRNR